MSIALYGMDQVTQPRKLRSAARAELPGARVLLLLLGVAPFWFERAEVQAQSLQTLTLAEALTRARESTPIVRTARATLQRARSELDYARGAYLPRMYVEASSGIGYDSRETTPNEIEVPAEVPRSERAEYLRAARTPRSEATALDTQGRLSVDYPVLDPARAASVRAAQQEVRAEGAGVVDVQRRALREAAELYVESIAAGDLLADAQLTRARRSEQMQAIEALVRAGVRPPVDAARARIELIGAEHVVETRSIELHAVEAALAASVGLPPGSRIAPSALDDASWPPPLEPMEAASLAVRQRPDLAQLEASLAASRARYEASRRARRPTAGLLATGSARHTDIVTGTGIDGVAFGAGGALYLRWSALDPQVWRRSSATRAETAEAARRLEGELFAVRTAAVAAAYGVARARAQQALAEEVLAAAEVARTAQNQRYRAGVASLLELLDSDSVEQTARRQRIEAERDHRIARVRLLTECGVLGSLAR